MLPPRRVELRALELVEPGPVRVAGHVEEADRAHQHVALVDAFRRRAAAPRRDGRRPTWRTATVTPSCRCGRRPNSSTVSSRYFCSSGCRACVRDPVVRLEREAVEVRADVDLGAGIGVVPPGAADAERRLVDRERVDPGLLQLHAGRDPAEPSADHHDPRRPVRTEQLLGGRLHPYLPRGVVVFGAVALTNGGNDVVDELVHDAVGVAPGARRR